MAGVNPAVVIVLRNLCTSLTGETSGGAVFLSTLVIVAMISPLKDLFQKAVVERFRFASRADRVLRSFELQVNDRMHAVQAGPIIRRLLEHAGRAFDAPGGSACLAGSRGTIRPLCTAGDFVSEGSIRVDVRRGTTIHGVITLSPPRKGPRYAEAELERLRAAATLVAAAIEEDPGLQASEPASRRAASGPRRTRVPGLRRGAPAESAGSRSSD